eukprot:351810-Chlamydomonas_euryale.AAC.2
MPGSSTAGLGGRTPQGMRVFNTSMLNSIGFATCQVSGVEQSMNVAAHHCAVTGKEESLDAWGMWRRLPSRFTSFNHSAATAYSRLLPGSW